MSVENTQQLLDRIIKDEKSLVFDSFNTKNAIEIGMKLYNKAQKEGKVIAFNISLNHRNLFHISMDGCAVDNDNWLIRKDNTVYRFFQSSYRVATFMEMLGLDFYEFYGVNKDYVPAGGGFPITIANVGVVGCISLGGMMPQEDHQFIVDVLKEYLSKE